MIINKRKIGLDHKPYIIAEMSANHNGDIETAFKIIKEAKCSGADAIKIQTYTPDTITLNSNLPDFKIDNGLWAGRTLYDLYEWAHTPWEWHKDLFQCAKENDLTIFSSPFDNTAIDLLEDLNTPAYKIASFEAIDLPLIKYAASTGKPMIISTGMANVEEIEDAICAAKEGGCKELAVLHCVSAYPAPAKDYNLRTLQDMHQRFGVITGLSDHTIDNTTAISSVALGASIIEKHFTLDRDGGGPDDSFSLEPKDLEELCKGVEIAWNSLGKIDYDRKSSEKDNIIFRRSIYAISDIEIGDTLNEKNIKSIRPGYGLSPKYLDEIIGKKSKKQLKRGNPVHWDCIK